MDPEKKSLNFIFPTKYVIPKSLKLSHWPSKGVYGVHNSPNISLVPKMEVRNTPKKAVWIGLMDTGNPIPQKKLIRFMKPSILGTWNFLSRGINSSTQ